MQIMSHIIQDHQNVYCICGIPLARKWEIIYNNFCVCSCDKETGKKIVQTRYFHGYPSALCKNSDFICVIAGEYLIQYSSDGEYLRKAHLGANFEHLLISSNETICISKNGDVRVLDKDKLGLIALIHALPCISKPLLINGIVVWITPSGFCRVTLEKETFQENKLNYEMIADSILPIGKAQLIALSKLGEVISLDLNNNTVANVKLGQNLQFPVFADNYLLIASKTELHQLSRKEE